MKPNAKTRKPRPGEKCLCGAPAVIVFIHRMGDVPSCTKPELETSWVLRRRPLH